MQKYECHMLSVICRVEKNKEEEEERAKNVEVGKSRFCRILQVMVRNCVLI